MNYKNTEVQSEEVQFEASAELMGYHYARLVATLDDLVKAQTLNQEMDFKPLIELIEQACDAEAITIEQERYYDEESNLFI